MQSTGPWSELASLPLRSQWVSCVLVMDALTVALWWVGRREVSCVGRYRARYASPLAFGWDKLGGRGCIRESRKIEEWQVPGAQTHVFVLSGRDWDLGSNQQRGGEIFSLFGPLLVGIFGRTKRDGFSVSTHLCHCSEMQCHLVCRLIWQFLSNRWGSMKHTFFLTPNFINPAGTEYRGYNKNNNNNLVWWHCHRDAPYKI